jgi:hypothetical protein
MSEHTSGPWKAVGRGIFADSVKVGTASHPRDGEDNPDHKYPASYDQSLANAQLMATAPSLLVALRELVDAVGGSAEALGWCRRQHDAAVAAIAKATQP